MLFLVVFFGVLKAIIIWALVIICFLIRIVRGLLCFAMNRRWFFFSILIMRISRVGVAQWVRNFPKILMRDCCFLYYNLC